MALALDSLEPLIGGLLFTLIYLLPLLLVLAVLSVLVSCVVIAYVLLSGAQGTPVGMGFGLAVMLYIAGASLLELCKADTGGQAA